MKGERTILDRENLMQLARVCAKADSSAPVSYNWNGESLTYNALNETLRNELRELGGTYALYRENKGLIFAIMEEVLTDILPKKVEEAYGMFAEIKTVPQGNKVAFRRKVSARQRAKQFITRVGLAGVYEVFKLNGEESFEVQTSAIGAAVQVSLEEFLDGRADMAELLDIVMEGMDEVIYQEIAQALVSSINQLPGANRVATTDFDEAAFDRLVAIAAGYGDPTIYCSYDFAVKMIPNKQWLYTDAMKTELWNNGHFTNYKGKKVIVLPNGFVDETNSERVIDPGYVWIIPSGGDDKPVKVVFEGETQVDDRKNADWSREIQIYKKVGVAALMTNNICSYIDNTLVGKKATSDMVASNFKYTIQ
jgi:hypothetical protein